MERYHCFVPAPWEYAASVGIGRPSSAIVVIIIVFVILGVLAFILYYQIMPIEFLNKALRGGIVVV